jgi:hypothetical protein
VRDEPGTGRISARSGEEWHCRALTALTGGAEGQLPLLLLDQRPEMAVRSGPDERVNLFVSELLDMGLPPVTTIGEQLAQSMERPGRGGRPRAPFPSARPRMAAGAVRRPGSTTYRPGRVAHLQRGLRPAPAVAHADHQHQPVRRTDRRDRPVPRPGKRAFTSITTLLDQAAHEGELAGGLVSVLTRWSPGQSSSSMS